MPQRSITMKDVAAEANVSLKTVSRHINGEKNIGPDLVSRIEDAIIKLGYQRNLAAASLRPGWTSKTVGMIVSDLSNPFYSQLAAGAEAELADAGFILIVSGTEDDHEKYSRLVQRLAEQRVDGFLIVLPKGVREPGVVNAPTVFLDRPPAAVDSDCVLADNRTGAREAVRLLHDKGARQIAFLGDSRKVFTIAEREIGYREALSEVGIDWRKMPSAPPAYSRQDAESSALSLLGQGADAIFASNNRAVMGALSAMNYLELRVPMVGFDHIEGAPFIFGGLTLVEQNVEEMGREAARLLLSRMAGESFPPRHIVLPTRMVIRGGEDSSHISVI